MMIDLIQKRRMEREIDTFLESQDLQARAYAKEAQDAIRKNDYKHARGMLDKANESHVPRISLSDLLVKKKKAFDKAAARRAIKAGKVMISGSKVWKDIKVLPTQEVSLVSEQATG